MAAGTSEQVLTMQLAKLRGAALSQENIWYYRHGVYVPAYRYILILHRVRKIAPLYFCPKLRQVLTDFQNYFTIGLSSKCLIKL